MNRHFKHIILIGLVIFSGSSFAYQKHALLIGINEYDFEPLEGPFYDVIALKQALRKKMNFDASSITTLLNEQATKASILSEIDRLYRQSKPGDDVFIYFSGHGTSRFDSNMKFPLPTTSGAFIPYDVVTENKDGSTDVSLIVGRTDLLPRLRKLDEGNRNVFVVIDACYAGNTVRGGSRGSLPKRFMNLERELQTRGISSGTWASSPKDDSEESGAEDSTAYPYSNTYYLSASGEHEAAQDISSEFLDEYQTFDGHPHGAFTDTLLRLINNPFVADKNKNNTVSYAELYAALKNEMAARRFSHTPHSLPTVADDQTGLINKSVLLWNAAPESTQVSFPADKPKEDVLSEKPITFHISPALDFASTISAPAGTLIVDAGAQADWSLVSVGDDRYEWQTKSNDTVASMAKPVAEFVQKSMEVFAWKQSLTQLLEGFRKSVQLSLFGAGKGSTARENESLGFAVNLPSGGYLMIANIDVLGQISVLYPFDSSEIVNVKKDSKVILDDFATVRPPFGQDQLIAFVFDAKKKNLLERYANKSFAYDSALGKEFVEMVASMDQTAVGADQLILTTVP